MATLNIKLLGPPVIYLDETPIQIQRRTHRALLYYLAEKGRLVSRAELLTLFWPEEMETDGRQRLREALSKLRASLPDRKLLIAHQDLVGLDVKRVSIDVQDFRRLIDKVSSTLYTLPSNVPLPEAIYQEIIAALKLWRNANFMAGANLPESHALDDWLIYTSQSLEITRLRLVERLADHSAALGNSEATLEWLRLAVEYDLLNDSLHHRILSLLIELGRRSEALSYLNRLKDLYKKENGSSVPTDLMGLVSKITADDENAASGLAGGEIGGWTATNMLRVPLVGQDQVLNELKLAHRRGGLAIVWGEAGSGKTRLVQELQHHLEPAPRVLMASARSLETGMPYQPLIDMLRHGISPEEWRSLPLVWARNLSTLLPELLIIRPEIQAIPVLSPQQASGLIFESIHQLFRLISTRQALLCFLDNAQWVDEASIAALAYLTERAFLQSKGLLVIAARPEDHNSHLSALVDSLTPPPVQIKLKPLSLNEISVLSSTIFGHDLPDSFNQQLLEETGGNPLFLLETLRSLLNLSSTPETMAPETTLPLAATIHGLVHLRLRQVSLAARQTLLAAAVIGDEFDPALLEKAGQVSPEATVEALEELEALRLIQPVHSDRALYRFTNSKIREVLQLELSPARRRLLNLRIGQVNENQIRGINLP